MLMQGFSRIYSHTFYTGEKSFVYRGVYDINGCCMLDNLLKSAPIVEVYKFFTQENAFAMVLLFIFVIISSYFLSRYIARAVIWFAQKIAVKADNAPNEQQMLRFRQMETYLSIAVAFVRVAFVAITAYITWRIISPTDDPTGVAAIGASALFIVFAGQTVGMFLRDLTSGAAIMAEKWFAVGDYVKIEPFIELTGVVEQFNLRSTKIRALSGEIVWVNNQYIQAAHVTPRGVRTMAVDVFTRDKERAKYEIEKIINTIPTGTMLLAKPLRITRIEKWNDDMVRFTIVGQTAPGREWLIQEFLVDALKDIDRDVKKEDHLFIYRPISRFADEGAAKKFKRAVRA